MRTSFAFALAALLLAACGHTARPASKRGSDRAPAPPVSKSTEGEGDRRAPPVSRLTERGVASMYADSLSGRKTANGERYEPDAMTCAHKTWPFGQWVWIRSKAGGKTATCRINDRGPFVSGRIIDLSRAVMRSLDGEDKGVLDVEIRATKPPS